MNSEGASPNKRGNYGASISKNAERAADQAVLGSVDGVANASDLCETGCVHPSDPSETAANGHPTPGRGLGAGGPFANLGGGGGVARVMRSDVGQAQSVFGLDAILATHAVRPQYTAGAVLGVIAIDLVYPKLPGNVVNASTYDFPVIYRKVSFEIEQLFAGDASIKEMVVQAARELEAEGVRAIVGACGFFAHFQPDVAAAVNVPVFLSSLLQLPMIKMGLKPGQHVLVLAADGQSITDELLGQVGAAHVPIVVQNVGDMPSFEPIRWGKTVLDNAALTQDLAALVAGVVERHAANDELPEIGAVLLECSDLPPYAWAIQAACGLPVFDFQTLIKWVKASVTQQPYLGYM